MNSIKKFLNRPGFNYFFHKHRFCGKLACKLNINHSLVLKEFTCAPIKMSAVCKYCGKKFYSYKYRETNDTRK